MDYNDIYIIVTNYSRYILPILATLILGSCVVSLVTRKFGSRVGSYLLDLKSGEKLPLTRWENAVGRSPSCDVVLEPATISRFHAVISKRRKGWVVADTNSKDGTKLNGEPVTKATLMTHGDKVSFGGIDFRFVDADIDELEQQEKQKRKAFSRRASVIASQLEPEADFYPALIDEAADKAYVIGKDSCVIGRAQGCDCVLGYTALRPRHCRVYRSEGKWYVERLDGDVHVNARSAAERRKLNNGDLIGLNGVLFVFDEHYKVRKRR